MPTGRRAPTAAAPPRTRRLQAGQREAGGGPRPTLTRARRGTAQGKSQLAAARNNMVDSMTNSSSEGFRLEGFDGLPSALQSCNPLEGSFFKHSEKSVRARRLPPPPSAPTACCECATRTHRRRTG
jgi:hypothetical protein